jgi:hypothetical protein
MGAELSTSASGNKALRASKTADEFMLNLDARMLWQDDRLFEKFAESLGRGAVTTRYVAYCTVILWFVVSVRVCKVYWKWCFYFGTHTYTHTHTHMQCTTVQSLSFYIACMSLSPPIHLPSPISLSLSVCL